MTKKEAKARLMLVATMWSAKVAKTIVYGDDGRTGCVTQIAFDTNTDSTPGFNPSKRVDQLITDIQNAWDDEDQEKAIQLIRSI